MFFTYICSMLLRGSSLSQSGAVAADASKKIGVERVNSGLTFVGLLLTQNIVTALPSPGNNLKLFFFRFSFWDEAISRINDLDVHDAINYLLVPKISQNIFSFSFTIFLVGQLHVYRGSVCTFKHFAYSYTNAFIIKKRFCITKSYLY